MNLWKKIYSYIAEVPIISVDSKISPGLRVSYQKGRYVLGIKDVMYSFEDEYTAFKIAFDYIKPEKREIKNALILGYGLGSVPIILNKRHKLNINYTGVEVDPSIIALAKDYSQFPAKSKVKLICADAYEYVQAAREKFDLIVVDVFIEDIVPEQFASEIFLEHLRRLMAPKGLIMFNRLYNNTAHKIATDGFFQYTFQKEFPEGYAIDTNGNLVMVFDDTTKKLTGNK